MTCHGVLLVLLEELGCALGELARQTAVAGLVHEELLVSTSRLLGVEGELLTRFGSRVIAEEIPVTAINGLLHLGIAAGHAALDGVHLAGAVTDNEGGAVIGLGLVDGLERLGRVGANGNLCDVYVTVGHGNLGQALLLDVLARGCELSDLTKAGRLGGLTARVRVDLGIEDEDVHVLLAGDDMIETTVADVVCPTIATEDPEALLGEEALVLE